MGKKKRRKESKSRKNYNFSKQIKESLYEYNEYSTFDSNKGFDYRVEPKGINQESYFRKLQDNNKKIVIATGPAGTGKTLLASYTGIKNFGIKYDKIIITRPVMTVDENIGFLPGSLEDKMKPWMTPLFDIFNKYYYQNEIKCMINEKVIEICPLAFMRGRTFENCWIIADEMQNATKNQMKMLLTRIGKGSKLILTGDLKQNDRKDSDNGLEDFLNRVKENSPRYITFQEFENIDIKRCDVVKEVLKMYDD